MNKVLSVKCPQCGTTFFYYDSKFRPFCSEKCKMVDLGHWLTESYKIPEKGSEQIGNKQTVESNDGESTDEFSEAYGEENDEESSAEFDYNEFEEEDRKKME